MNQENQVPVQELRNTPRHEEVEQAGTSITESNVAADAMALVEVQPQDQAEHNDAQAGLPPAVQLEEQPTGKEEEVTQGDEFGRYQPNYDGQAQLQGTTDPLPMEPGLSSRYRQQGSHTQVLTGAQLNAPTSQNQPPTQQREQVRERSLQPARPYIPVRQNQPRQQGGRGTARQPHNPMHGNRRSNNVGTDGIALRPASARPHNSPRGNGAFFTGYGRESVRGYAGSNAGLPTTQPAVPDAVHQNNHEPRTNEFGGYGPARRVYNPLTLRHQEPYVGRRSTLAEMWGGADDRFHKEKPRGKNDTTADGQKTYG